MAIWYAFSRMMNVLFLVLVLCVVAIFGVAVAVYVRINKKVEGSATSVRQAVQDEKTTSGESRDLEASNGEDV